MVLRLLLLLSLGSLFTGCTDVQPVSATFKVTPQSFSYCDGDVGKMLETATYSASISCKWD